ncbi:ABC transporter permease [Ornithinimicrobium faecis]|uniref:ABC transporter permease n=1 Tax=Ornithinimicrobium faecis TaxID=2934158 RepID=A0ABY4YRA4_9MICO|nr:ABC transporter permease [Ornithinimicrobium sp. HY1793]USQ79144.1 ABC transporter permease [Ornithinimicrobium sp. HY1793]
MTDTTTASPATPPTRSRRESSGAVSAFAAKHFGVLSIAVVFVVLFAFFSIQTDNFFTSANLVNVARQVAPTVIVAMAMTFVITTGQIDLSVGSTLGLSAAVLGIWASTGNPLLALVLTLVAGLAIGTLNGLLTAYGMLQSFIVTLAALTAIRGLALLITGGYSEPISSDLIAPLAHGKLLGLYTPTWIAIAAVVLAWYVFTQTKFGRYVTAVGSNGESLRRAGVDIRRIQMGVLALTGLAAAVAGILTAARLSSGSPNSGTMFELEVITAVVLGGTSLMGGRGSVVGTAIGALTLGIINNGLVQLRVDVYWVPIVQGLILVVAILLNSKLFSRIARTRK